MRKHLQATWSPTPRAIERRHIAKLSCMIEEAIRQGDQKRLSGLEATRAVMQAGTVTVTPVRVAQRAA